MSATIQKPLQLLFPYENDSDSAFYFPSKGIIRTQSASPRISSLSHFSSMPNLCDYEISEDIVDFNETSSDHTIPCTRPIPRFTRTIHEELHVIKSPVSVISSSSTPRMSSFEAPARLNSPKRFLPLRQRSNSIACDDRFMAFCSLETSREDIIESDLPSLVLKADSGLKSGVEPMLAEDATGGSYFLRDKLRSVQLVFKPSDEEANAPNNPHKSSGSYGASYKGRIVPGFGMYRELAAFAIDHQGFAGVPPTDIAKVRSPSFFSVGATNGGRYGYKIGSVQSYVRSECSAEEMGYSKFDVEDVMRIAILDVRICNLDRHAGNILVTRFAPYQSTRNQFADSSEEHQAASSAPSTSNNFVLKSNPPSPSNSNYRLVPIDHGFCLPHILQLSDATFTWLTWPQVKQPLSEELKDYVKNLDADKDCEKIRQLVGAAIPETCLLSLKVCTNLLKIGIEKDKSLFEIASLMIDIDENENSRISKLQAIVNKAIRHVVFEDIKRNAVPVSLRRSSPPTLPNNSNSTHGKEAIVSDEILKHAMSIKNGKSLFDQINLYLKEALDIV